MAFKLSCILLSFFVASALATTKLQKHFEWNILDFEYADEYLKRHHTLTGKLQPQNALPVGIEVWGDKMFISVPRWKEGIPSTLNYVNLHSSEKNPALIPYPSLEENELGNCQTGLNTVYRIHADKCDRLWVLDTGTFGIENTTQNLCPYTINIFDLRTNRRIHRYQFRPEDTNANTFIANTLIDVGKTCDDAHAYFSDELGYGLIVYSLKQDKSWRFEHGFFHPDPLKGDFNIDGLNFQWFEEGIFGMSLSPEQRDGSKTIYFSPLASEREFAVSNKVLQNEAKAEESYSEFYPLNERGKLTHTTSRVMNKDGIQFFNLIDQNGVGCWNSKKPHGAQNIAVVDKNDKELIFPADIKIDRNNYAWVISDRMPRFLITSLDYSEPNFRVFFAPVEVLIRGTVCELDDDFILGNRGGFGRALAPELNTNDNVEVPLSWSSPSIEEDLASKGLWVGEDVSSKGSWNSGSNGKGLGHYKSSPRHGGYTGVGGRHGVYHPFAF